MYIADLLQIDGVAAGGKRVEVGQVYLKAFIFTFAQIRAKVEANCVIVRVERLLQLLHLQSQRPADACVAPFPHVRLQAECPEACWRWSVKSFSALVSDDSFTFRPVHLASSKAQLLDIAAAADMEFYEHMYFIYR